MKKTLHLAVLGLLTTAALVLLFCEVENPDQLLTEAESLALLLATKLAVVPLALLIRALWRRWRAELESINAMMEE